MAPTVPGSALMISPHLDDVALSCPALLRQLRGQGRTVYLLNVFTEDIAQAEAKPNHFATTPYSIRRAEDDKVTASLGLKVTHLGFSDAPFRAALYANWLGIVFGVSPSDRSCERRLAAELLKILESIAPAQVYLPLAAGRHIDHRIVCEVVRGLFPLVEPTTQFWFYEDRPYVFAPHAALVRLKEMGYDVPLSVAAYWEHWRATQKLTIHQKLLGAADRKRFSWRYLKYLLRVKLDHPRRSIPECHVLKGDDPDLDFALRLAKGYPSQFPYLFTNDEEFLLTAREYAVRLVAEPCSYAERYWRL